MLRRQVLLVLGLLWCLGSSLVADEFADALKFQRVLDSTTRVNFVKTPIADVVAQFRKQFEIDIRILDKADGERTVTFAAEQPLETVLRRLLGQCGLKFRTGRNHLQIEKMNFREVLKSPVEARFRSTPLDHAIFRLSRQYGVDIFISQEIDRKQPLNGHAFGNMEDVLRRLLARAGLEPTIKKNTIVIVPLDARPTLDDLMEIELQASGEWKDQWSALRDLPKAVSEQWNLKVTVGEGVEHGLLIQLNAPAQALRELLTQTLRPHDLTFDVVGDTLLIVPLKSPDVALETAKCVDLVAVPLPHALRHLQDHFQVKISDGEWANSKNPVTYKGTEKLRTVLAESLTPRGLKYQVDGLTIRILERPLQERLDLSTDVQCVDRRLDEVVEALTTRHAIKVIFADDVNQRLLIRANGTGNVADVLTQVLAPYRLAWKIETQLESTLRIMRRRPPTATERVDEILASQLNVLDLSETPLEDGMKVVSLQYGIPIKIENGVNLLLRPGKRGGLTLQTVLSDLLTPHNLHCEVSPLKVVISSAGLLWSSTFLPWLASGQVISPSTHV